MSEWQQWCSPSGWPGTTWRGPTCCGRSGPPGWPRSRSWRSCFLSHSRGTAGSAHTQPQPSISYCTCICIYEQILILHSTNKYTTGIKLYISSSLFLWTGTCWGLVSSVSGCHTCVATTIGLVAARKDSTSRTVKAAWTRTSAMAHTLEYAVLTRRSSEYTQSHCRHTPLSAAHCVQIQFFVIRTNKCSPNRF